MISTSSCLSPDNLSEVSMAGSGALPEGASATISSTSVTSLTSEEEQTKVMR